MILILKQLTEILAKLGISCSHEGEVLKGVESLITPPATYEESCTFDGEKSCKQEIKEDHEELQHGLRSENYAYEIPIE